MTLAWWQDPDEAPSRHEPPDPVIHHWFTPTQETRTINDVYADYLNGEGACRACGGKNGHASGCAHLELPATSTVA